MCQLETAILSQFVDSLGVSKRLNSTQAAQNLAVTLKNVWGKNPERLSMVRLSSAVNEAMRLAQAGGQCHQIATVLIEELDKDIPTNLVDNPDFEEVLYNLKGAIAPRQAVTTA